MMIMKDEFGRRRIQVGFEVLTAVSMKMAVFSFISSAPSSGDRPDDGGSKYL
jgi:hypothetical protein